MFILEIDQLKLTKLIDAVGDRIAVYKQLFGCPLDGTFAMQIFPEGVQQCIVSTNQHVAIGCRIGFHNNDAAQASVELDLRRFGEETFGARARNIKELVGEGCPVEEG